MLSIERLKSAKKAGTYYQGQDNYYAAEGEPLQGIWVGLGAEKLALTGTASVEQFKAVLAGRLAPDIVMENVKQGKYHRPGYDLTFSAPKSVSILAVIAKDEGVIKAHRTAINGVLKHIEQNYSDTRVKKRGKTSIERTGNLIFCTFEHNDSRMLDPNLHTHAIIMNALYRADGKWRTLRSDRIYDDKIILGMLYRSILAQELMKLGFEIVQTSEKGTFEIKDFPEVLIEQFSKRGLKIKAYLKEMGLEGGKAAKIANFNTRPHKRLVDPEHLELAWTVELAQHGFSIEWLENFCREAKNRGPMVPPDPALLANQAVVFATRHLSSFQPVFNLAALKKTAMGLSIINHSEDLLQKRIEKQFKTGALLYLGDNLCTTQEARDLELLNAAFARLHKNQVQPLFSSLASKYLVSKSKLQDKTHQKALSFLLRTSDREIAIHYEDKKDQAVVMNAYLKLIKPHHIYPVGLTEKAARVEAFGKALGLERTQTLEGFLLGCEKRLDALNEVHQPEPVEPQLITSKRSPHFGKLKKPPRPRTASQLKDAREIWILDAASSISLSQVRRLQGYAGQFGARIIWAHHPFKKQAAIQSLMKHGLKFIEVGAKNKTQQYGLDPDSAVKAFEALVRLGQVTAKADLKERQEAAVAHYLTLPEGSGLVTLTHGERKVLNQRVREAKIAAGTLMGTALEFKNLQPVRLSPTEKCFVKFYQLNDVIRFTADKPALNVNKNDYLLVTDVEQYHQRLTLKHQNGESQVLALMSENTKVMQLYRPEARELCVNEVIMWHETQRHSDDKSLDRLNGETAVVLSVGIDAAEIRLKNHQKMILHKNILSDSHWDYGYAATLERGDSIDNTHQVVVLKSGVESLNPKALARILSENQSKVHIFCDDIQKTKEMLLNASYQEMQALDKPIMPYRAEAANALNVLSANPSLKSFFPKLNHRLETLFSNHPALFSEVLNTYESEKKGLPNTQPSIAPLQTTIHSNDAVAGEQIRTACQTIDWLCAKFGERQAVFSLEALSKELFLLQGLSIPKPILEEQLTIVLREGILIPVQAALDAEEKEASQKILVTTKETVLLERACLYLAERGKNQVNPILSSEYQALLSLGLLKENLTKGQQAAIECVLTTADRVVGIQGISGSGKTTMLKILNGYVREAGVEIIGLSNSTSARLRLAEGSVDANSFDPVLRAGVKTLTTRKFLMNCRRLVKKDLGLAKAEYGGRLLVLDESSFASTRDVFELLILAEKLDFRLMVMGDNKQLNSVEAGRILYLLLGSNIRSIAMTENVRLQDAKAFKTLQHLYKNEIEAALKNLGDSIIEIPDTEERLNYIADRYLEKTPEERLNTLVINPLNKHRSAVNLLIHQGLKNQNELLGKEFEVNTLTPVNMTQAEKEKIYYFKEGDWIRFNQPARGVSIQIGEYCQILGKRFLDRTLLLKRLDSTQVYWSPERNIPKQSGAIEVYTRELRLIMNNECIRWLKNDEQRGMVNGETAKVAAMVESIRVDTNGMAQNNALSMEVLLKNGTRLVLDVSENLNQHFDYAYAATTHIAQGADKPETFAEGIGGTLKMDEKGNIEDRDLEKLPKITTLEDLLVITTRGDKVTLVVDNLEAYKNTLLSKLENKRSAQEYLDPNREAVRTKVHQMTENITGRALKKPLLDLTQVNAEVGQAAKSVKSTVSKQPAKKPQKEWFYVNEQDIIRRLHSDILGYASRWLGPPKRKNGREARWDGALSVVLSGSKAGRWKYWTGTAKTGKNLLSLYMHHYSLDYTEALKELASELGISSESGLSRKEFKVRAEKKELERAIEAKKQAKIAAVELAKRTKNALQIYNQGKPLKGTLGEKYLREFRGITGTLPEDFRFCPRLKHRDLQRMTPALVAPIRNSQGDIQSIVRIFLDKTGQKLKGTYTDVLGETKKVADKLNLGSMENAAVVVNRGKAAGVVYIAEGVETALSVISEIQERRVLASLSVSHIQNVPIPVDTQKVILCADEDGNTAASNQNIVNAANAFLKRGLKVEIAYPTKIPELSKTDFNDLLKQGGLKAVEQDLQRTLKVQEMLTKEKLLELKTELIASKEKQPPQPNLTMKELER